VSLEGRSVFFAQLLEAIAFLREHGIWHRDVKPDNILVRSYEPPDAMLTDFGCASDNLTIPYDRPGTVPYLAPEQVEGKTHGRAVDYWSCGLVGLELILRRAITSRVTPERNLPDYQNSLKISDSPLATCSIAMLQVDPNTRMTAADALSLFTSTPKTRASNKRRIEPF
jgi:serine/threonine protein kinase